MSTSVTRQRARLTIVILATAAVASWLPAASPVVLTGAQRDAVERILQAATTDDTSWRRLAYLCDRIGNRLSGTPQLDAAIRWALEEMRRDGFDDVHPEKVMVPCWVRGAESATLLEPAERKLSMLGLGNSVGTPADGITADVLVVRDFDELESQHEKVGGKLVCFNVPFTKYSETVEFRAAGASRAARHGAVGALVRSVTPTSLDTPHTGALFYDETQPKIPAAAITVEAAEMLSRMQERGERIRLRLKMEAQMRGDVESANVVAELRGSAQPEEIVLVGGHLDSWDVGSGSQDDGGGCLAAWEALRTIKRLGLRPRRTIRLVLFTNEENGLRGAVGYRDAHRAEIPRHVLAIETDSGTFRPKGFDVSADPATTEAMRRIAVLLDPIGAGTIEGKCHDADIEPLQDGGVPCAGLRVDSSKYFHYHHTTADTLDKVDPKDLGLCAAALGVLVYVVADLPERIGR